MMFRQMSASNAVRLLLIAICWGLTKPECTRGYIHFGDSCYYFSTESLDWFRAESSCRGHNARLAEIDNKQQSDFLINEARKLGGSGYWLGGRDDIIEGEWRWASTDKAFSYTAWYPGQPSNGGSTGNEDCVHLNAPFNMLWNDASCLHLNFKYICEKPFEESEQGGPVIGK